MKAKISWLQATFDFVITSDLDTGIDYWDKIIIITLPHQHIIVSAGSEIKSEGTETNVNISSSEL